MLRPALILFAFIALYSFAAAQDTKTQPDIAELSVKAVFASGEVQNDALNALRDRGIKLKIRPVAITSWENRKRQHPDTRVLSLETGHRRNYSSGYVYRDYFASPDLMFPTIVRDERTAKRKDYVYGIRTFGAAKAWPLEAFKTEPVINDKVGSQDIVLIGNHSTRTVRAYQRNGQEFVSGTEQGSTTAGGKAWTVTEDTLVGPEGEKLPRVPGHISYWFAWDGYLGTKSELYKPL